MWKRQFPSVILDRGLQYFQEDRVHIKSMCDTEIIATVEGSEPYDITVAMVDHFILHMSCSCPYAIRGNNCKHMVAVLFEYDSKQDPITFNVDELLAQATPDQLRQALYLLIKDHEVLIEEFDRFLNYKIEDRTIFHFKKSLELMSRHYDILKEVDEEHALSYYLGQLDRFLNTVIPEMITQQYLEECFYLTSIVFTDLINKKKMRDDLESVFDDIYTVWILLYQLADRNLKHEMYFWFKQDFTNTIPEEVRYYIKEMIEVIYNDI